MWNYPESLSSNDWLSWDQKMLHKLTREEKKIDLSSYDAYELHQPASDAEQLWGSGTHN